MKIKRDLSKLAMLKIKMEVYTDLYDKILASMKEEAKKESADQIEDTDNGLVINLVTNDRRVFDVDGVREVLGDKAEVCIYESVDAKKFDVVIKNRRMEYLISEEQQRKCFSIKQQNPSARWEGFEAYQAKLTIGAKHDRSEEVRDVSIKVADSTESARSEENSSS
jgi:hypothetical protein